ncbi:hypothetical protein OQJ13_01355 [Legionella sp. PATHC035]|nr:hypothetical protein [Legionella sp. PATHC035]MCW8407621.1 hypothetical protein [Legionella sp. PATHC035]
MNASKVLGHLLGTNKAWLFATRLYSHQRMIHPIDVVIDTVY